MSDPQICPQCRAAVSSETQSGCAVCGFASDPNVAGPELENAKELEKELELELEPELEVSEEEPAPIWSTLSASAIRPKRKEVSLFRKVLPPLLGGLSAIPIATAIMWYGVGRDLGNLGPFVAKFFPDVVPKHLRGDRWSMEPGPRRNLMADQDSALNPLPKLDRDEPSVVSSSTPIPSSNSDGISETLRSLRDQQRSLNTLPKTLPKDQKIILIANFYRDLTNLSRQASSLQGRSDDGWRDEIAELGRDLVSDASCRKVLLFGPEGKLPGVPMAGTGDFLATVLELQTSEVLAAGSESKLRRVSHLPQTTQFLLFPESSRGSSVQGPKTFFVLGKLVPSELEPTTLLLEIHSISSE